MASWSWCGGKRGFSGAEAFRVMRGELPVQKGEDSRPLICYSTEREGGCS